MEAAACYFFIILFFHCILHTLLCWFSLGNLCMTLFYVTHQCFHGPSQAYVDKNLTSMNKARSPSRSNTCQTPWNVNWGHSFFYAPSTRSYILSSSSTKTRGVSKGQEGNVFLINCKSFPGVSHHLFYSVKFAATRHK